MTPITKLQGGPGKCTAALSPAAREIKHKISCYKIKFTDVDASL
jgi:hypothetical protein